MLGSPCFPCCAASVCPLPSEISVRVGVPNANGVTGWPSWISPGKCTFLYGGPSLASYAETGGFPSIGDVTASQTSAGVYTYDRLDDAGTSKACNLTAYSAWYAAWEASGFNDAANPVSITETLSTRFSLVVWFYRYGTGTYDPPGVAGTDEYGSTQCGLVDFYYGVTTLNRWSHGIVTQHDFEMMPIGSYQAGGNPAPGTFDPVWTGSGWKPHQRPDGTDTTQYQVWTPDFPIVFGPSDTQYRDQLYVTAKSGGGVTVTA